MLTGLSQRVAYFYPTGVTLLLLLPLERDSELLRERESVLRLRERRWLDGASFDTERGSTSREGEANLDKKSIPVQSPVSLGEELQWWPDKVSRAKNSKFMFFKAFGRLDYCI